MIRLSNLVTWAAYGAVPTVLLSFWIGTALV
jgi:hypothetical protein